MKITKKEPIGTKWKTLADLEVGDIFAFRGEVYYYIKMEHLEGFDKAYAKVFSLYDSKVERHNLDASVDLYEGELLLRRKYSYDD